MSKKFFLTGQDLEDYEQEIEIKKWLEREGISGFEFSTINRNGNPRHIGDVGAFSLDEKIGDSEESGTYADIIAGSYGRDQEHGENLRDEGLEALNIGSSIESLLAPMGLNWEVILWAKKLYKSHLSVKTFNI